MRASLWRHARQKAKKEETDMMIIDRIALALTIIGAFNWGRIGLFSFDFVAWIGGGQGAVFSRIVYTLVALAGIWCLSILFRPSEERDRVEEAH